MRKTWMNINVGHDARTEKKTFWGGKGGHKTRRPQKDDGFADIFSRDAKRSIPRDVDVCFRKGATLGKQAERSRVGKGARLA